MKLCIILFSLNFILLSCSDYLDSDNNKATRKPILINKVVDNITTKIARGKVKSFNQSAHALKAQIDRYCRNTQDKTKNVDLKNSWKDVVRSFHSLKLVSFGPTKNHPEIALAEFYSFPYFNRCQVDRLVLSDKSQLQVEPLAFNTRGLVAIEYLLFEPTLMGQCLTVDPDIELWNQKTNLEKTQDRCELAQSYADELSQRADKLLQYWSADDFVQESLKPENLQSSLTEIVQSFLELEDIKDKSIKGPLNLNETCEEVFCLEDVEHPWSNLSFVALQSALDTALEVFTGGQGRGIADYLGFLGHKELADQFVISLGEAIKANQKAELQGSFTNLLTKTSKDSCLEKSTEQPLCLLLNKVNEATIILKSDILTVLSLEVTIPNPGDNDGA